MPSPRHTIDKGGKIFRLERMPRMSYLSLATLRRTTKPLGRKPLSPQTINTAMATNLHHASDCQRSIRGPR